MSKRNTYIGITLGDINGIGPELAVRAAYTEWPASVRIVLLGDASVVEAWCTRYRLPVPAAWSPAHRTPPRHPVSYWDPRVTRTALRPRHGTCTAAAARAAYRWIGCAAEAAMNQRLHGLVTAPIQKEGFLKAGISAPGHTELLADCAGVKHVEMMLLADAFRVVLATRHLPLRDVAQALNRKGIQRTIHYTAEALHWLGARRKRIAVCGLNPHAGDGGALGHEEQRIIRPAIRAARRPGLTLTGPVPADTVFHQVRQGAYDAVVAMYHDQGLAPFKMWAFEQGVNLTLGLPFVRTSPDHGTAYNLAGTGRADCSSMRAAIACAIRLAHRPNPWAGQ